MADISYKKLQDIYECQDADIDTKAFNSRLTIQREWHREKLRHVLNADIAGKIVLDAGCGSGAFDREMEKKARLVFGVDINKFAVSYANGRSNISHFLPANIEKLPFRNSAFDVVVCLDALDHCLRPGDVIREFSRVLKRGGKGVVIVQNHTRLWKLVEHMWDRFGAGREYGHVHVSRFDRKNILRPFRNSGLGIEEMYSIHHLSPLVVVRKPWNYPGFVEKRIRKKFLGFSIVVVVRKE